MQLDHINITAPGHLLDELRDFYRDVLGLTEGYRPTFSRPGYWLYADDRPVVHLIESGTGKIQDGLAALDHVAFRSRGLEAMKSRLEAFGVGYQEFVVSDIRLTQLFVTDPAGTRVEINFPGEG
ncbi:MAG: diguanylate cyclase [Lysobacterales bacterium]|jgi:catechol 2,3-dioxygenase-like lactoylglutathione lyase family enzyme